MKNSAIFCVVACALAVSAPATAQLSSGGGPIQVKAERSEVLDREKKVVISGNVDIIQGESRLQADRVVLNYTGAGTSRTEGLGGGFGDIKSMEASGEVFYVTPDLKANGQNGVYDAVNETIKLGGEEVILLRGEDVARGKCLVIELAAGRTNLYGSPCGSEGSGRVIFVIDQATASSAGNR